MAAGGRPRKRSRNKVWRYTRKTLERLVFAAVVGYVWLPLLILYLACGVYDVVRQGRDLANTARLYFLISGSLCWAFSPINTLIDILSLPFVNKKIYELDDLPEAYRAEIREVTEHCRADEIIAEVNRRAAEDERTMLLYRWYGFNTPSAKRALFQKDFEYILTIGVSSFKAQTKTDKHFGWLRAGIRVLYNLDPAADEGAYIIANGKRHTWSTDGPLFIFDDTVLHQSFNLTDRDRHCLFIDVLRPSYVPFVLRNFVKSLGFLSRHLPYISKSSNWRLI